MTDKIQPGSLDRYTPVAGSSRTRGASAGASGTAASSRATPAGSTDSISLTGEAALLQEASAAALASSGIDTARVDEVRQQLRDGSYQIDPQMIASKMLKTEWELANA